MVLKYADFEIGLHRRTAGSYAVELSFRLPDAETDLRDTGEARFDLDELRALAMNPLAYGQKLAECLFASQPVAHTFASAQARVQQESPPLGLRVRLLIGSSAPELHGLYWETLTLPQSADTLSTSETMLFSRYLSSRDWRPVRLRPRSALKALVVVASPADLEQAYALAPIDSAGEIRRAKEGLGAITAAVLPGTQAGETRRATLNALVSCLRSGEHDILYLVCHGKMIQGEPWLLLEDDMGNAQRVSGVDLVSRLQDLPDRPRLVVLLSCQSAGSDEANALTALGPRLAEAGIPAVLAMQGSISMETAERFMSAFFREMRQGDGLIDRALAVARGEVRDCFDFWMPVLYSRLKSSQIWYVPHFSGSKFEGWQALENAIREKRCTPVLGLGLLEPWTGPSSELAWRWAEKYAYPLARDDFDELPRIAQFISRRDGDDEFQSAYRQALREEILKRHRPLLPDALAAAGYWTNAEVLEALRVTAEQCWDHPATLVHRQLAALRLPVYITTSPDNLLAQALERSGAKPVVRLCPWWGPDAEELEAKCLYSGAPSAESPLVYHLYGHLDTPESLVISEDNYFDFLIGFASQKGNVPAKVREALTLNRLLFLGFRTNDWGYRVLFRTIMALPGAALFRKKSHVNAQVEPEEGRLIDTRRALGYLEKIFTLDRVTIYWGRSEDFVQEMAGQLRAG